MSPGLHTAVAEVVAPADPTVTYAAVGRLVDLLWDGRTEVLSAEPPAVFVHTVVAAPGSDDVDAWLTWEVAPATPEGSTRVRLTCDEADISDGPPPELDEVLRLLVDLVHTSALR
jgi:hypothetical protein